MVAASALATSAAFAAFPDKPIRVVIGFPAGMITQGADPAFMGSDEFGKFLAAEMPRWAQAVKASGAKLD